MTVLSVGALAAACPLAAGCGGELAPEAPEVDLPAGDLDPSIIGSQRSAAAYSEAVMVKVNNAANDFCTGTVIAPYVVLTAAHCIVFNGSPLADGTSPGTWTITAQFASPANQVRTARYGRPMDAAFWSVSRYDYESHPELHDIGILILDTPFTGVSFPTLSSAPFAAGQYVSAVGRQTANATAGLVLSARTTLSYPTSRDNEPFCAKTTRLTGGGDSGGPLYIDGTHRIVGTEALFRSKKDYWTRIDLAYAWIDETVRANGGW